MYLLSNLHYLEILESKIRFHQILLKKNKLYLFLWAIFRTDETNLTMQIHDHIDNVCTGNEGVAVMVSANHLCACVRGVKHDATMKTSKLSGEFMNYKSHARKEFYSFIEDLKS